MMCVCVCVKCDACARCGLSSKNTLHYSFGWQSEGPYPLALPHHNTPLRATTAAGLHARPERRCESAGGLSAYQHMGQDIWVHIYIV